MRGEEKKNKEMITIKNEERSGKCDEKKNNNDQEKNEDATFKPSTNKNKKAKA